MGPLTQIYINLFLGIYCDMFRLLEAIFRLIIKRVCIYVVRQESNETGAIFILFNIYL